MEDDPLIGQTFGKDGIFTVRTRLGEGGMGAVYEVWDKKREKRRAMKFLRTEHIHSTEAAERFRREGERFRNLSHPHLVRIYGLGRERGQFYIVSEFVDGDTLHERNQTDPLSVMDALKVGEEIADGLAALHEQRIVHRDLKPANVMLCREDGLVKVLDFGLAKFLDDSTGLTQVGFWLGTPGYAAPEQIKGGDVDHRADLFALGAILYRIVVGTRAFDGPDDSAVVQATLKANIKPPAEVREGVPAAASRLIQDLLEKKPARRPEEAAAVRDAIAAIRRGQEPPKEKRGLFGGRR